MPTSVCPLRISGEGVTRISTALPTLDGFPDLVGLMKGDEGEKVAESEGEL